MSELNQREAMVINPRTRSSAIALTGFFVLGAFLLGCQKASPEPQDVTLRIAGVIPLFFEMQYGNRIHTENYEINIEFVPYEIIPRNGSSAENLEQLYTRTQPDVVNWSGTLSPLIDQGLLAPLDAYIKRDGFDTSAIPAVLKQRITSEGSDDIYAIPNRFSTEALFYNRSMLDRLGMELSDTSPMTWEQLFRLAAAVPPEDVQGNPIIRFLETGADESDASKLYALIRTAALAENLKAIHKENGDIYVDSDNWKQLWHTFIGAFNQNLISTSEDIKLILEGLDDEQHLRLNENQKYKPFTEGQAVFVLGNPGLLYLLLREEPDFDWGIAPQPGTFQVFTQMSEAFLINPSSGNKDAAWELLSYLTNEEQARRSILAKPGDAKQLLSDFPMHMDLLEQQVNQSLAPFYSQPSSHEGFYDISQSPDERSRAFYENSLLLIDEVLQESMSIDEALEQLQTRLEFIRD